MLRCDRRWLWGLMGLLASTAFAQGGFFKEEFLPPGGKGPAVLVLSGQSGPQPRVPYVRKLAEAGYYVVLVDGNDMLNRSGNAARHFNDALAQTLASPANTAPKAAVLGFSLGGGGTLLHALHRAEQVSMAVLYYPATSWIADIPALVSRVNVPALLLAAEKDSYRNCCPIERARQIEQAAKGRGLAFELVVYPQAEHAFDLPGPQLRAGDTDDAWQRTLAMLARLQPVKP